ncbi:MAG: tRNA pseudouridine(13) synthase TruD [Candidatus Micrarchaeota archaeon]|nr:tRNA pseudouridine(13) synthase TruD [Candidatus Micrarchaeota archaeon]
MRFLTQTRPGISFTLNAQTFHVHEIDQEGKVVNLDYRKDEKGSQHLYIIKKKNWSTDTLLKRLSYLTGIKLKYIGFAGMKDKNATTYQRITLPRPIEPLSIKDVEIVKGGTLIKKLRMGDLWGNLFHVYHPEIERLSPVIEELPGYFLNYFGEQRFGRKCINVKVGLLLLQERFEEALQLFLTYPRENNPEILEIRKRIQEGELPSFPKHMKHENWIVGRLREGKSPKQILLELPRNFSLLFIHSVQSYIFNKELDLRYDNQDLVEEGYLVGYDTNINPYQQEILQQLNLTQEHFQMRSLPTLRAKGAPRKMLERYFDLKLFQDHISFKLPRGSYATTFLKELTKNYEASNCD